MSVFTLKFTAIIHFHPRSCSAFAYNTSLYEGIGDLLLQATSHLSVSQSLPQSKASVIDIAVDKLKYFTHIHTLHLQSNYHTC